MSTQQPLNNINVFTDLDAFQAHTTPAIGDDELTLVGGIAVVVESYRNGTEWYRIWSDGHIEQGGYIAGSSTNPKQVTLLVPMSDVNYNPQLTAQYTTNATNQPCVSDNASYPKTTSSFYVYNTTTTTYDAYWEVRGK